MFSEDAIELEGDCVCSRRMWLMFKVEMKCENQMSVNTGKR